MAAGKAQDLCSGHLAPWLCEGCTAKTCWDYVITYCWLAVRNCPDMVAEAWKAWKQSRDPAEISRCGGCNTTPREWLGFCRCLQSSGRLGPVVGCCWAGQRWTKKSKKMMEHDKNLGPEQLVFRSLPLPIFLVEFVQVLSSCSVADGFFWVWALQRL